MLEENFDAAGTRSPRCNLTIYIQQNQKLGRCILRLESTEMVTTFGRQYQGLWTERPAQDLKFTEQTSYLSHSLSVNYSTDQT